MANKNAKATAARAQAQAQAQAQLKAKERRTTVIIIAASLAVIAVFAGIIFFVVDSSKTPTLADVEWPAGADATGGIVVGAANADANRVDVYFDFMCPWCAVFEETNGEMLVSKAEAGEISLYYHPLGFLDRYSSGTAYSSRAANAAAVVADQDAQHFSAFVIALFDNQPQENTTGLTDVEIAAIAVSVGVPQEVADTFVDGAFNDWVLAATQQASIDGINSTPSLMVNREVVEQTTVPFMQEGALEGYLASLTTD